MYCLSGTHSPLQTCQMCKCRVKLQYLLLFSSPHSHIVSHTTTKYSHPECASTYYLLPIKQPNIRSSLYRSFGPPSDVSYLSAHFTRKRHRPLSSYTAAADMADPVLPLCRLSWAIQLSLCLRCHQTYPMRHTQTAQVARSREWSKRCPTRALTVNNCWSNHASPPMPRIENHNHCEP